MAILDKVGSLRIAGGYESISLEPGAYNVGKLPYCAKVPKIREIIYCADGIFNRKTYMVWRNMIYKAGYTDTMIGAPRRHLATSKLEHGGQFSWNSVFGTFSKSKLPTRSAMGRTLYDPRLMVEPLPKATAFGRKGEKPPNAWGPEGK